ASAVGLICIRIFGCSSARACDYALNLGVALQLTNILRDVGGDLALGRVYLPQEDLRRFGCTVDDVVASTVTVRLRRLMWVECQRARDFYQRAKMALPPEYRRNLIASEILRGVLFATPP